MLQNNYVQEVITKRFENLLVVFPDAYAVLLEILFHDNFDDVLQAFAKQLLAGAKERELPMIDPDNVPVRVDSDDEKEPAPSAKKTVRFVPGTKL